jgi:ligand-binding sensor domain-containing protein
MIRAYAWLLIVAGAFSVGAQTARGNDCEWSVYRHRGEITALMSSENRCYLGRYNANAGQASVVAVDFDGRVTDTFPALPPEKHGYWGAVSRMLLDRDERLWVLNTGGKLFLRDGGQWVEKPFAAAAEVINPSSLCLDSLGRVWWGVERTAYCLINEQWVGHALDSLCASYARVSALCALGDSGVAVAFSTGGSGSAPAATYVHGQWQAMPTSESFGLDEMPDVVDIVVDTAGRLWALDAWYGPFVFENSAWSQLAPDGLGYGYGDLSAAADGAVWMSSNYFGVVRFVNDSMHVHPGIPAGAIHAAPSGDVWAGRGSLHRFSGEQWRIMALEQSPPLIAAHIGETADGSIWFGGPEGIARRRDGQWIDPGDNAPFEIDALRGRDSVLWVASGRKLYRFKDEQWQEENVASPIMPAQCNVLEVTGDGIVLMGTDSGLVLYPPQKAEQAGYVRTHYTFGRITDICIDTEQRIWAATTKGVAIIGEPAHEPEWKTVVNSALPHNKVRGLCVDSAGAVWIGTDRGFVIVEGQDWRSIRDSHRLLLHWPVQALACDAEGSVWASITDTIITFRGSYGNEKNCGALGDLLCLYAARDGGMWVGGADGWVASRQPASANAAAYHPVLRSSSPLARTRFTTDLLGRSVHSPLRKLPAGVYAAYGAEKSATGELRLRMRPR